MSSCVHVSVLVFSGSCHDVHVYEGVATASCGSSQVEKRRVVSNDGIRFYRPIVH